VDVVRRIALSLFFLGLVALVAAAVLLPSDRSLALVALVGGGALVAASSVVAWRARPDAARR
jgi:hypothetical protein